MAVTKIVIVSDSHRLTNELETIKQRHEAEVDFMIHCGDSELSAESSSLSGFITVRGNCDGDQQLPEEAVIEACGRKLFVTHGHLFSVKSSLVKLKYRAMELGASIVCFGHSHMLGAELIDDILFINPGSIKLPRGRKERTYCLLSVADDYAEVSVYELHRGEISNLKQHFHFSS